MTRLHQLAEARLATMLDGIEQDMNQLKSQAQTVGAASVLFTQSDSGTPYDWTGKLAPTPGTTGQGQRMVLVTATAETENVTFGDLVIYIYLGSPTNWRRYPAALADVRAGNPINFPIQIADSYVPTPGVKAWTVWLQGDLTSTFYLKGYVLANDQVSIAMETLS